eukprot:scaffold9706_cov79-Skeletonema_dohrnii-CCMP3373.AAC.5
MRIELTTLGLLDPRSNQLSYEGGGKPETRERLSLHATLHITCKQEARQSKVSQLSTLNSQYHQRLQ